MHAIAHTHRPGSGARRHVQIELGIAHHQRLGRRDAEFFEYLHQHQRLGLGRRLVCATGSMKEPHQPVPCHDTIEPAAALTRRYRYQMPLGFEQMQRFQSAVEEPRGLDIGFDEPVGIAVAVKLCLLLAHARVQGSDRLRQAETDDIAVLGITAQRKPEIARGGPETTDDP